MHNCKNTKHNLLNMDNAVLVKLERNHHINWYKLSNRWNIFRYILFL